MVLFTQFFMYYMWILIVLNFKIQREENLFGVLYYYLVKHSFFSWYFDMKSQIRWDNKFCLIGAELYNVLYNNNKINICIWCDVQRSIEKSQILSTIIVYVIVYSCSFSIRDIASYLNIYYRNLGIKKFLT